MIDIFTRQVVLLLWISLGSVEQVYDDIRPLDALTLMRHLHGTCESFSYKVPYLAIVK